MRILTAVVVVFLAACGPQLPINVHIDDSWSAMEEETIISAMEEWNTKAAQKIFVYEGRRVVEYNERTAREDGYSLIYRVFTTPHIEGTMESDYGLQVGGNGGDVILIVANIWPWVRARGKDGTVQDYREPYSFSLDADEFIRGIMWKRYRDRLKTVTLHELGHLAGIEHLDGRRPGIMNDGFFDRPNELQPADIKAFCQLHGC